MVDPAVRQHWEPKNIPLQIASYERQIAEIPAKVAKIDDNIQRLESVEELRAELGAFIPQLKAKWNGLKAQQVQILQARRGLQLSQQGIEHFLKGKNIDLEPDDLDAAYQGLTAELTGFLAAQPKARDAMREKLTPLVKEALLERIGQADPRRWGLIRVVEKDPNLLKSTDVRALVELYHQQGIGAELFGEYLAACNERDALAEQLAPVLRKVGKGITVATLEQERVDLEAQRISMEEKLEALRNPLPQVPAGALPPPPPPSTTCSKTKLAIALAVVVALALLTYVVLRNRSSVAVP